MQSPHAVATLRRINDPGSRHAEEAQDLIEYGVLAALVALAGVLWNAVAHIF